MNDTVKTYSPLFVKTFASNHNLQTTYCGIKKRQANRRQSKLSGRITKKATSLEVQKENALPAVMSAPAPGYGAEGQSTETPAYRENLNTHMICPDCRQNPPDLTEENAEIICLNCGMVLASRVQSYESEWRTFNSDESRGDDPNRVGEAENELLNGDQLTTQIGGSGAVSKETRKLQRAQGGLTAEKSNKALQAAYRQIDLWADKAELSTAVRQAAKQFYKDADDKKAFKTKSQDAVLAGCLFIACRQLKQARSFAEIFGLTSVPKKEIGRVYKQLESFLTDNAKAKIKNIEDAGGVVNHQAAAYESTQSAKASDLCERYCNMLGLGFRIETISKKLAERIPGISTLAGRSPLSNAAACIYFASHLLGKGASIKSISEVANVSDATIKHAYKFLLAERDNVVDPSWLGPQPGVDDRVGALANLPSS